MSLTAHDRRILHLAARSPEGRLTFHLDADGSIALLGPGEVQPLPAEDSLPRLEELGLMSRAVSRSYVLTPAGWDEVRTAEPMELFSPFTSMLGA